MIQATWHGQVLAESDETQLVDGNHYFPLRSIRRGHLQPSQTETVCSWKGTANYYTITVDGQSNPDAAFTYRTPNEAAAQIKDHVAFWKGITIIDTAANEASSPISCSCNQ